MLYRFALSLRIDIAFKSDYAILHIVLHIIIKLRADQNRVEILLNAFVGIRFDFSRSALFARLSISDGFGRLTPEAELTLFRIVQESLTNVYRHSGSKTAAVRLSRTLDSVYLEIQDEGRGMPPEKLAGIQSGEAGVGVAAMQERIRRWAGEMKIDSTEKGTKISVKLPGLKINLPDISPSRPASVTA